MVFSGGPTAPYALIGVSLLRIHALLAILNVSAHLPSPFPAMLFPPTYSPMQIIELHTDLDAFALSQILVNKRFLTYCGRSQLNPLTRRSIE